ncbi:hypothetical protein ZEAMMB73_Zm00001d031835 [Zea mays]|uniref:Uncharacterized protein n=1 Tax=Zea mays TaxID=4577 RepID=A0A1D6KLI0_MAIZE|nr:hypothetical protein ZEAMMB73_Zm00001d031835 [Zea mays]
MPQRGGGREGDGRLLHMRKSFKDSLKVLEADIQHANTLKLCYAGLCRWEYHRDLGANLDNDLLVLKTVNYLFLHQVVKLFPLR